MTDQARPEKRQNVGAVLSIQATIRPLNRKEADTVYFLVNRASQHPAHEMSNAETHAGSHLANPSISGLSNFIAMLDEHSNPSVSFFAGCLCRQDEKLDQ